MRDLIKQEQFEIEVLNRLNSGQFLRSLVFCGGTMLRLCHGLNRFSVDLDFWLPARIKINPEGIRKLFRGIRDHLARDYALSDAENKFYTMLFELKSPRYPRNLKIEIRKDAGKVRTEKVIAYSRFANDQVFLTAVSLEYMMKSKIETFIQRKEIRDAFDLEFLLKKGIALSSDTEILEKITGILESLSKRDYTVKLGSLLENEQRKYYISENFKILKRAIREKINAASVNPHDPT